MKDVIIEIEKKKIINGIRDIVVILVAFIFLLCCLTNAIISFFHENLSNINLYFALLSLIFIIVGIKDLKFIHSKTPFCLFSETELILYDNPEYSKIPYSDMIECKYYSSNYEIVGIRLKEESTIKSNNKGFRWQINNPPNKTKKYYL